MEQPNKSYINSLSGGDLVFEEKLMAIIKNEFPQEKEVYQINIKNKNLKLAAENVHKLKHKISILGLGKSYDTATRFETNLLEGNTGLYEEFESILDTISAFLKQL